jgi:glutathione peroxidase
MSIFNLKLPLANGQTLDMESLRGRVLLVVNTATACGFARQLWDLDQLQVKYADQGFTLIVAPCNGFSEQEPLDNDELCTFFSEKLSTQFPVLAKLNVDGMEQSELYRQLQAADPRRMKLFPFIPWNFTKLLINQEGKFVKRFVPLTPMKKVEKAVAAILEP